MNFSYAAIAALTAASRLRFVEATPFPIGRYELFADPDFSLQLDSLDPSLEGKFIVEGPQDKVVLNDDNEKYFSFDLYTVPGGDDEPCDAGEIVAGVSLWTSGVNDEIYAALKQTSDGHFVIIHFSIPNVRTSEFYTQTGQGTGVAKACIRAALLSETGTNQDDLEVVSYLDAQLTLNVDDTGAFLAGGFDQEVTLSSSTKLMQNEQLMNRIPVESFVCGTKGINGGSPIEEEFKIGQDFQICIRPTDVDSDFKVVSFKDVFCGIAADGTGGTKLVDDTGAPTSDLTIVTSDVEESMDTAGTPMGVLAAAFKSVVTPSYFSGAADSFRCKGEAILQHKDTPVEEDPVEEDPVEDPLGAITGCHYVVDSPFELAADETFQMGFCINGVLPVTTTNAFVGFFRVFF
ncbi:unnamed protein product [Pseudo-nitzschia multistriata]|uniref:Uncharacterized protein n=1 Tax=Pseudo-nitzschia multistriata TaxID=183589 RepID=A0A448Z6E5_9STRA|nr:unnamed protein product [Pseudo-nitzschia multistriata]